jgi:hypothetical protein
MRVLFQILCIFSLFACQKKEEKQVSILPPSKMVQVLIEIHLAESQIPHLSRTPDSSYLLYKGFERKIFQKLQIDSTTYQQSYQYYLNHLDEFEKIYAQVIDSLVYREVNVNIGKPVKQNDTTAKGIKKEKSIPKRDSLMKQRKELLKLKKDVQIDLK